MKKGPYKIGTLGSHSALQILKGAHDEGFATLLICEHDKVPIYRSFKVADTIIEVDSLSDTPKLDSRLAKENMILIPHGSFLNVFRFETLDSMKTLYFGNRKILPLENDRVKQREWLKLAGLTLPRIYSKPEDIDGPVMVKSNGPGGGKGYFLAKSPAEFKLKIRQQAGKEYIIQQYVIGNPLYVHYFQSPLTGELEIMGMDKRYETNVDSIGRISAKDQQELNIQSSYHIIGNMPIVVRESLLPELYSMGEKVIDASQQLTAHGLFGPFCLEMVVTPELEFYVFEISARIVAGTNPYINGSPYTDLRYNEPMSSGRRIAREIKQAIKQDRLREILY